MKLAWLGVAATIGFAPSSALAQADAWSGFYAGANIGYGWHGEDAHFASNDEASNVFLDPRSPMQPTPLVPPHVSASGVFGGVQFGYNHRNLAHWILGLEADWNIADLNGSGASQFATTAPIFGSFQRTFTASVTEKVQWFGTLRARAGYLINEQLLIYGSGGFAYGQVKQSAVLSSDLGLGLGSADYGFLCPSGGACFVGSRSSLKTGWTVGAGFERVLFANTTLKAEYNFINLGKSSYTMVALDRFVSPQPASFTISQAHKYHTVRVGLNWHF